MLGGPDFLMQILKLIFLIKNQCNVTETKKNTIRKMHIHCGQLILRKISKNWCHQTSAGTLPQTLLGELTVLLQIPRLYFMDLLKTSKGEGREGDERVEEGKGREWEREKEKEMERKGEQGNEGEPVKSVN